MKTWTCFIAVFAVALAAHAELPHIENGDRRGCFAFHKASRFDFEMKYTGQMTLIPKRRSKDPVAVANREFTGVGTLMWGNDYPHPEGTWPHSQARCAEQFDGVPSDELAAIVGGNAARVFGFAL